MRWSRWVYRALLLLYPRSFRRRHGAEMEADALKLLHAAGVSGARRGRVGTWLVIVRDVVISSAGAWRAGSRWATRPSAAAADAAQANAGRFDVLMQDVRFGLRRLRRSPGFAVVVTVVLGLGIGATTVIYSALRAVVLEPLPYPEAERLVAIYEVTPEGWDFSTSQANFLDFRTRNRTLVDVAAYAQESMSLGGEGEPQALNTAAVSGGLFALTGVTPVLGRTFLAEEDRPGGVTNVVLLSEGLWRTRFGADPTILGRPVELSGTPYDVVGVLPARYAFPWRADIWVPLAADAAYPRSDHRLAAIGRLRDGVTFDAAAADLNRIASDLAAEYPPSNAGWGVRLETFPDWLIGSTLRRRMVVLLSAVSLLLLLACTNVSNLMVVRSTIRQREMGVRAALGASRARVARQLLTESLLLALLGGVAGLAVAYGGLALLRRLAPGGVPRLDQVALDGGVLWFVAVIAVSTGVIFGMVPVLHAARRDIHGVLRAGTRVDAAAGRRMRNVLVIGELALATMLLVGAGLLLDSFRRLDRVDTGYDTENVLAVPLTLAGARYPTCEANSARANCDSSSGDLARLRFVAEAVARLEAVPGVRAVGVTNITPLSGGSTSQPIDVEGRVVRGPTDQTAAAWRLVTSGFFRAAGIEILEGRNYDAIEDRGERRVMIVSAAAAKAWWPNQSAIGKRIGFGGNRTRLWEVIGVAGDVRDTELESEPEPTVYPPFGGWWPYMTLVVRVAGDPALMAGAVRSAIRDIDPALPVPVIRTLHAWRADAMASARFSTLLMTLFAGAALLLAVLGVYGVTMFSVSRRTREIGLRMALGARRAHVVGSVVLQGAVLAATGILLGSAGALAFSRFLQALLFGTTPVDARVYAAVAATLAVVATMACLLPAVRAARVDPKVALGAD